MSETHPKIFYSEAYNIRFFGLEKFYPFDGCKYEKIWQSLQTNPRARKFLCDPKELKLKDIGSKINLFHDLCYINKLQNTDYIASILELPDFPLRSILLNKFNSFGSLLGFSLIEAVLKPMQWAVAGTVKSAHEALNCRIAVNLSGGYHHAERNQGGGFCVYSDIGIAIEDLKVASKLHQTDSVLIIDLDAHQGNGLERIFLKDESVYIFDMYNKDIYPKDKYALRKQNLYSIPLDHLTDGTTYLSRLQEELPQVLDVQWNLKPKIAFYNAGTDVFENDPLGGLKLTMDQVLERDKYVFETLTARQIPFVMLLSGGYTPESHTLVTESIKKNIIERW